MIFIYLKLENGAVIMEIKQAYTTNLETLAHGVAVILNDKVKATSPEATVDYVAFALDNIEAKIERAKQAKKELDGFIAEQTSIKDTIKQDTAKWLNDTGLTKLEGMRVSSLTTYEPKAKENLTINDREFFIKKGFGIEVTTITISPDLVKEWLVKNPKSKRANLEVVHSQPLIKINKKRGV